MSLKLETPAFIAVSAEAQTPRKVGKLVVDYKTSITTKNIGTNEAPNMVNQGVVNSWLFDEQETNIMQVQKTQEYEVFEGKEILAVLHDQYKAELSELNPTLNFINSFSK